MNLHEAPETLMVCDILRDAVKRINEYRLRQACGGAEQALYADYADLLHRVSVVMQSAQVVIESALIERPTTQAAKQARAAIERLDVSQFEWLCLGNGP